ncbi:MAG: TonB-dependent receptor [Ignavibacteria bacterium]|nr:TonB-dependent receptor [Ignavibacteria bacterium]
MKKIILLIMLVALSGMSAAQTGSENGTVTGVIYGATDKGREALDGAVVKWINTKKGVLTDAKGKFEISSDGISDFRLIISYIGYSKDTVDVRNMNTVEVTMKNNFATQQIVVEDEMSSSFISNEETKTEVITQTELKKDACCDLSGCFGKNASVDVAVTDILTNTKELKVLGLEGAYTQVLVDNSPLMSGLVTKYGVTSIPGTLINKIMISKGSNSVLQGYESISGIMNVLLKDYATSDRFLLNGFLNNTLENQLNLNATAKTGKWNTIGAFQMVQEPKKMDDNADSFLDSPLTTRYMLYNKWKYGESEDDNTNVTIGAKYLDERRVGGQKNYSYDNDKGSNTIYGQTVDIENGDLYARISRKLGEESQLKFFTSGMFFNQDSWYGVTKYDARQRNFNVNAIFEFPIGESKYLRSGVSYKYESIDENINLSENPNNKTYAGNYDKLESVPGVFTEASFDFKEIETSVIAGLRFDYHNKYNLITTPRLLVRYQPMEQTAIRFSVGTGFRTVNLFSEYSNLLASGKNILIPSELEPEKMINYGIDILQYINLGPVSGNITLDFYRTDFSNKIQNDYEKNFLAVTFLNNGASASNVFQVETNLTFYRDFDFKLAYKLIDLYYNENGNKVEQPFNAKHRVLSSLGYSTPDRSWNVNFAVQWFGTQNLPNTAGYPEQYQRQSESDPYTLINGQVSKNFRNFEVYAGVENILDFTQPDPIISPDDPFSPYFDTSYIWGPTMGRTFYTGFRILFQ